MSEVNSEVSFEPGIILTPDRRVRVFVSSTLGELREEREAAREAIEELHLTPVMFETGARSHPPRDLYRAYLAQSDVFVGIYGDNYGWVAPGMDRSGLEDEYRLSGGRPRLIYVRDSQGRDSRLSRLIEEIGDDGISYRHFGDCDQLRRLLVDDLAVLLTERFYLTDGSQGPRHGDSVGVPRGIPIPANTFIGRESETSEIIALLSDPGVRLVTIDGPGGVGKSRLALEVAARLVERYAGVALVLLEEAGEPDGVLTAILAEMGVSESALSPLDSLKIAVSDRSWLFVLDNFEQVLDAAPAIGDLLEFVPTCQLIITSRVSLGIRAEHLFTLEPLAVPDRGMSVEEILSMPSVELFVSRAEAAGSRLMLEADVDSLAALVRLLEGVPLSLELAAGRMRLLSPGQILERLEESFELLESGSPDLPLRHRSIEATIRWSFNLLAESEASLAGLLSVFDGGFTVESAEAVCGTEILDDLSSLVAKNLIRVEVNSGTPRLAMLRPVRNHAARSVDQTELEQIRTVHAEHFLHLTDSAADGLRGPRQIEWLERLSNDHRNVTTAIRHAASEFGADRAATSLWNIYPYLEYMGECREALSLGELILSERPARVHHGRTLAVLGLMSFWLGEMELANRHCTDAVEELTGSTDDIGLAYARGLGGVLALMADGGTEARLRVEQTADRLEELGDQFGAASLLTGVSWMGVWLGLGSDEEVTRKAVQAARKAGATTELAVSLCNRGVQLARGADSDEARNLLAEGLRIARTASSVGLETLALASVVEVVADSPSPTTAITMVSAIEVARRRQGGGPTMRWTGIPLPSLVVAHLNGVLARLRGEIGRAEYRSAWEDGQRSSLPEATRRALQVLHPRSDDPAA